MPTVGSALSSRLFLGVGGGLHQLGTAPTDLGQLIGARWRSERLAVAGEWGEASYRSATIVVAHTAAVTLLVTPIVDERIFDGADGPLAAVTLPLGQPASGRRTFVRRDLILSRPYVVAGIERGRLALRGTWFQLDVRVTSAIGLDVDGQPGVVFVDGVAIEFDVERLSAPALGSPAT